MRSKLLLLLLVSMLLQTCGNAAIVECFSIKGEGKNFIFVEGGKTVGCVKNIVDIDGDKLNVRKVLYKNKTCFMKDAKINTNDDTGILELRNKIGGIVASRILNNIFKDKEKRYPLLSLAFNPESSIDNTAEPFHILSEELKGFTSIADEWPHQMTVDDLENLYMGMYLIGGGDPHMHNIFYNSRNHHLGSVDLDVSFKEHIPYNSQLEQSDASFPDLDFFRKYSDLAIRIIDCNDIFINFLFATDSRFNTKVRWNYYNKNIPFYQENLKMNGTRLSKSIDILHGAFPSKEELRLSVINTVSSIKKDLKKIINEKLQLDTLEGRSIFDDSGDYFDKDSDTYKKYKENSLIKSIYFLFDKDKDYAQEVYQFVENRYLTLICIFNNPNDIVKEICERCLLKPEVREQNNQNQCDEQDDCQNSLPKPY